MTLWDFYGAQVERRAKLIKSELREELTREEAHKYYLQEQDNLSRQDLITVKVTERETGRALSSSEVTIDESNVRMLQEGDDAVVLAALHLAEGEQQMVERRDGSFAQLECLTRTVGGFEPFDSVVQAVASQLANQRLETELQLRAGGAF